MCIRCIDSPHVLCRYLYRVVVLHLSFVIVNAATKTNTIFDNVIRRQKRNSVNAQNSNESQWTGIKLNVDSLEELIRHTLQKINGSYWRHNLRLMHSIPFIIMLWWQQRFISKHYMPHNFQHHKNDKYMFLSMKNWNIRS